MKKPKKEKPLTRGKVHSKKTRANVEVASLKKQLEIEASLEKVRSRSLAMHRSDELQEVVKTVFDRLHELNFVLEDGAVSILIFKENSRDHTQWIADPGHSYAAPFEMSYTDHSIPRDLYAARERGDDYFAKIYPAEEKNEYFSYLFTTSDYKILPDEVKSLILGSSLYGFSVAYAKNAAIVVPTNSGRLLTKAESEILKRFVRVFDQAYTRFLDLQKAEAQAREAQIEAALERVRASTMSMHQSSDLHNVIEVVTTRLLSLGLKFDNASFCKVNDDLSWELWISTPLQSYPYLIHLPYLDNKIFNQMRELKALEQEFFTDLYSQDETRPFFEHFFEHADSKNIPDERKQFVLNRPGLARSACWTKDIWFSITVYEPTPFKEEENSIIRRFAKVFEQSYTRFLDLQKAEAQAREAQIEAALERVRARTMAMQKSDELADVASLLFRQVHELGIKAWTTGFNVWSDDNGSYIDYITNPAGGFIEPYTVYATEYPVFVSISAAKKRGEEFYVNYEDGETLKETYRWLLKFANQQFEDILQMGFEFPNGQYEHFVFGSKVSLMFITYEPVPEAHDVFKRFGKVFEQTYTRFLDLQRAEAQTREAQIDAALERVRSKTMAMHNSDDMGDTVVTMFDELVKLGVKTNRCGVLIHSDSVITEVWAAMSKQNEKATLIVGHLDTTLHPMLTGARNSWLNKESFFSYELAGEDIRNYYKIINDSKDYRYRIDLDALPAKEFHSDFHFREGSIFAFTAEPIAEESSRIFHRFAGVFGQAYTRFLDLQKAEEQAREAKLEASLERVRGKAMSMHSSEDLAATIGVFYRELQSFSITPRRCGVGLVDKENRMGELSTVVTTDKGESHEVVGKLKLHGHPVLEGVYDNWILQQEYHPVLRGNEIKEYYQLVRPQISFPEYPNDAVQFGYFFFFPEGAVYAWTEKELVEDELKIYRRFTSVLSLTYKRYKDLKDAEIRAKEAVKQATLDRVRAEIASMRTKQDLDRITPLIWNELTILGIPFKRCGVFIMDDNHRQTHAFLSTPEGKAIGAFHLDYNTSLLKEAITHWHDNEVYITYWGEKEFGLMADILLKQGSIASLDQYLKPEEGIHLHFLPFVQGMLYVGNTSRLDKEDIGLLKSLAEAFSTAYARYEDFTKLEVAKQQVDQALIELKQTQQQLVQSEKMASLGELTAGIAHEIQNPLNFVNNFSEVSNELIDEMAEEIKKGNFDEAKLIANDLKQNLDKIHHHGKRADGIVKSMLQHSRISSGLKELTDINLLCDEYIRLSYHGLRAKDKTFNAKFETDFDATLEKINVVPQDIGRVILNLINNAFYAVTEKRKSSENGYEPIVSIATRRLGVSKDDAVWQGKVEITVKDNGGGVPQKVLDKIFQPFFTTKPTGQGTGLGLSLSYDIVKSHAGEIMVETKEGEGSTFILRLPIN